MISHQIKQRGLMRKLFVALLIFTTLSKAANADENRERHGETVFLGILSAVSGATAVLSWREGRKFSRIANDMENPNSLTYKFYENNGNRPVNEVRLEKARIARTHRIVAGGLALLSCALAFSSAKTAFTVRAEHSNRRTSVFLERRI